MLKPGDEAPEFQLADQDGGERRLSALLDGKPLILYFYPADFTPGCTREACDMRDLHGRILADNLAALRSQTDARGRSFEFIPIPEAYDVEPTSEVFARSYINFALTNGGVVMPSYGRPSGDEAEAAVARAFPDRRIVTVDVGAVVPAGGAIHCITQEQSL